MIMRLGFLKAGFHHSDFLASFVFFACLSKWLLQNTNTERSRLNQNCNISNTKFSLIAFKTSLLLLNKIIKVLLIL